MISPSSTAGSSSIPSVPSFELSGTNELPTDPAFIATVTDIQTLKQLLAKAQAMVEKDRRAADMVKAATQATVMEAEQKAKSAQLEAAQGILATVFAAARKAGVEASEDDMNLLTDAAPVVVARRKNPDNLSQSMILDVTIEAIHTAAADLRARVDLKNALNTSSPRTNPISEAEMAALMAELTTVRARREVAMKRETELRTAAETARRHEKNSANKWTTLQTEFARVRDLAVNRQSDEQTRISILREEVVRFRSLADNAASLASTKADEMLHAHLVAVRANELAKYTPTLNEVRNRGAVRMREGIAAVNEAMNNWLRQLVGEACREVQAALGAKAAEAAASRQAVVRARRDIARLITEIQDTRNTIAKNGGKIESVASPRTTTTGGNESRRGRSSSIPSNSSTAIPSAVSKATPAKSRSTVDTPTTVPAVTVDANTALSSLNSVQKALRSIAATEIPLHYRNGPSGWSSGLRGIGASNPFTKGSNYDDNLTKNSTANDTEGKKGTKSHSPIAALVAALSAGDSEKVVELVHRQQEASLASSAAAIAQHNMFLAASPSSVPTVASPTPKNATSSTRRARSIEPQITTTVASPTPTASSTSPRKIPSPVKPMVPVPIDPREHDRMYARLEKAWDITNVPYDVRLQYLMVIEKKLPFFRHIADMWRAGALAVGFTEKIEIAAEAAIKQMNQRPVSNEAVDAALAASPAARLAEDNQRRALSSGESPSSPSKESSSPRVRSNIKRSNPVVTTLNMDTSPRRLSGTIGNAADLLASPLPKTPSSAYNNHRSSSAEPLPRNTSSASSVIRRYGRQPDIVPSGFGSTETTLRSSPSVPKTTASPGGTRSPGGGGLSYLLRPTFSTAVKEREPSHLAQQTLTSPRNLPDGGVRRPTEEGIANEKREAFAQAQRIHLRTRSNYVAAGIHALSSPRSSRDPMVPLPDDNVRLAVNKATHLSNEEIQKRAAIELADEVRRAVRLAGMDAKTAATAAAVASAKVSSQEGGTSTNSTVLSSVMSSPRVAHIFVRSPSTVSNSSAAIDRLTRPTIASAVREATNARDVAAVAVAKIEAAALGEEVGFTIIGSSTKSVQEAKRIQAQTLLGITSPNVSVTKGTVPKVSPALDSLASPRRRHSTIGGRVSSSPRSTVNPPHSQRRASSNDIRSPATPSNNGRSTSVDKPRSRLGGLPGDRVKDPFTSPQNKVLNKLIKQQQPPTPSTENTTNVPTLTTPRSVNRNVTVVRRDRVASNVSSLVQPIDDSEPITTATTTTTTSPSLLSDKSLTAAAVTMAQSVTAAVNGKDYDLIQSRIDNALATASLSINRE